MTYPALPNFHADHKDGSYARDLIAPVDNIVLTGGTYYDYTIPAGAKKLLLAYDNGPGVWVKKSSGAVVPNATVVDGTGMRLNPTSLIVTNETVISFICSGANNVTIEPYAS